MAKLSSDGSSLTYSTFLGGSRADRTGFGGDVGRGIAVDSSGNAYVTGQTSSTDFPTAGSPFDSTHNSPNGDVDGFVAKLSPDGSSLSYSTFLGGSGQDEGHAIALDSSGNAYVTGQTSSTDFPTAGSPFDSTHNSPNGDLDVFVAKFNFVVTNLGFTVQPTDATAGTAISPAVKVAIQDAAGNLVTTSSANITVVIGTNPGSGTLSGTTTVAASGGVATFSNLSIDKARTGYTLVASASGLTGATSQSFNITVATAAQLGFKVQPGTTAAGAAITPAVEVAVQDQFANTVSGATQAITFAIGTNPGGGALSGTTTLNAVNGVATFANLSIDKTGTGYTLTASASGLTGATSSSFNITPGAANQLRFKVEPSHTTAGAAISPAVEVAVHDGFGNLVTGASQAITVAIGTNPGGGSLSGTATVNAVNGVATFANLSIDKVAEGYTLTASASGLTGATSQSFNITVGSPAKVGFTVQPTSATAGTAISPAVKVAIQDAAGNLVTTSSANITVVIGTNPGSGTLSGTTTVAASGGVTTFSNLSINKAGTGYTLVASSSGLTSATSQSFNITAATAVQLGFLVSPPTSAPGATFVSTVAVQDIHGNSVTSDNSSQVTVAIKSGTGTSGATLNGTTTVPVVSGVATFNGLSIAKVGNGYQLRATSEPLFSADSDSFSIGILSAKYFPVLHTGSQKFVGFAFANPSSETMTVDLEAFNDSGVLMTGSGITNPVTLTIPPRQQVAHLATGFFGSGITSGYVVARSVYEYHSFFLEGMLDGSGIDGAEARDQVSTDLIFPNVVEDGTRETRLVLINPTASTVTGTLELLDSAGTKAGPVSFSLGPGQRIEDRVSSTTFFAGLGKVKGYVRAQMTSATGGLSGYQIVGASSGDFVSLRAQDVVAESGLDQVYAHVVAGGGYETIVTLINPNSNSVNVVLNLVLDGSSVSPLQRTETLGARGMLRRSLRDLFSSRSASGVNVGYLQATATGGSILGSISFQHAQNGAAAALPGQKSASTKLVFSHVAVQDVKVTDSGWLTGVALLNPNTSEASITITVFRPDGSKAGVAEGFKLGPGKRVSRLLAEFVREVKNQAGGYIVVESSVSLYGFELFGDWHLKKLAAVSAQ